MMPQNKNTERFSNARCGACLFFKSPGCPMSTLEDVKERRDAACSSFYALADRLSLERRVQANRSKKRFLRMVEDL